MKQFKSFSQWLISSLLTLLMTFTAEAGWAQNLTVSGNVTDPQGEPLIGAAVRVVGSTSGTVTDYDGQYMLQNVQSDAQLEFSYVGYETQTIAVSGKSVINVVMSDAGIQLQEMVVVGYGSLSKKEVSSSIVQVNAEDFNMGAMNNAMEMLNGKVAGLNVATTAAANPNSSSDLQIRGAGSLTASNTPLIVIDGIAGGDIRNIAAQDIESITVLKDAGSAAIYGTRGANGVILVTTKKGKAGDSHFTVTYDSYVAANVANARPQTLTADEFRRSRRGIDYGYETDWYSLMVKPATYDVNQYVAINGSTKSGYYSASFNYKDAKGLDIISARREYGARFAAEQKFVGDHLVLSGSLSGRRVNETWGNDGQIDNALNINPTMPVKNEDGSYYQPTNVTGATNPITVLKEVKSEGKRMYLLGNADLKYNIWHNEHHNVSTNINYALQYNDLSSTTYASSKSNESYWGSYKGRASINYDRYQTHRVEWLANYNFTLSDHALKLVVGYSWERNINDHTNMSNNDFAYDETLWYNIGSGSYLTSADKHASMGSSRSESTLIGMFGRVNYSWRDMLFLSASYRREGSTKFGVNNKWGNFGSGSIAWDLMGCDFMKSAKSAVDELKPRISYGVTGRADFDSYKAMALYGTNGSYWMDGEWIIGYAPTDNVNPDLKWEKNIVFNVGIDFSFWGRLRGSVEYYNRQSKDLLYNYTAPKPPFAKDKILVNVGSTSNQGVEVVINGDIFKTKDFTWNMGINYSYGRTKLTKLSNDLYKADYLELYNKGGVGSNEYLFRVVEGGYVGQFYGYEYAGVNEKGDLMVRSYTQDADGNYTIPGEPVVASKVDLNWKQYIGNGAPQHFLSWNNSWRYKGWDFSMMWRGAFDYVIYNQRRYGMGLISCGTDNVLRTAYTKEEVTGASGGVFSDYFLERGDYFKLDNITIGYNFTAKQAKYFQNLRLYLTAKNICTLTGYSGNDPSIVPSTGITPGVDSGSAYPTATQLSLGITLNLK